MRTVLPDLRTLPSSTAPTLSLWAIVSTSTFSPLNEKDEVRAATCSSLTSVRELSSSSVSPSEKYSCSLSPLMLTNGSTAIECGGGAKATDLATQGFSTMKYAATAASATASATHAVCKREDLPGATGAAPRATVGEKLALP